MTAPDPTPPETALTVEGDVATIREEYRKWHYYKTRLSEILQDEGSGSKAYDDTLQMQRMYEFSQPHKAMKAIGVLLSALATERERSQQARAAPEYVYLLLGQYNGRGEHTVYGVFTTPELAQQAGNSTYDHPLNTSGWYEIQATRKWKRISYYKHEPRSEDDDGIYNVEWEVREMPLIVTRTQEDSDHANE